MKNFKCFFLLFTLFGAHLSFAIVVNNQSTSVFKKYASLAKRKMTPLFTSKKGKIILGVTLITITSGISCYIARERLEIIRRK